MEGGFHLPPLKRGGGEVRTMLDNSLHVAQEKIRIIVTEVKVTIVIEGYRIIVLLLILTHQVPVFSIQGQQWHLMD